jgi:hypothetical protein
MKQFSCILLHPQGVLAYRAMEKPVLVVKTGLVGCALVHYQKK